jgi:dolichol-phosphate mannosyltransferase
MTNPSIAEALPIDDTFLPQPPAVGVIAGRDAMPAIELTVVVPTLDEVGNIEPLVQRLSQALRGIAWEVIFVDDDSRDGTADRVQAISAIDTRVHCLRRVGQRGLASACLDGLMLARGRFVAVIDADLQHDESLLPAMLCRLRAGDVELVVGSRYAAGGDVGSWGRARHVLSRCATAASRRLLNLGLTDPLSGFFMADVQTLRRLKPRVAGTGFKLLLDLVTAAPAGLRCAELPYRFATRHSGRSKLGSRVALEFGTLLAHRLLSREEGGRMFRFGVVGGLGVIVHLTVLTLARHLLHAGFAQAQTLAVIVSMVVNFALNNALTFPDRVLRGRRFFNGLSRFAALCSVGAAANIVAATEIHAMSGQALPAALAGILVGAAWNYATSATFVWQRADE